jgi:hypothetical protein
LHRGREFGILDIELSTKAVVAALNGVPLSASWTADADTRVVGAHHEGNASILVTTASEMLIADFFAVSGIFTGLIWFHSSPNGFGVYVPLDYQLYQGETVYFSSDAGAIITLWVTV